MTDAGTALLAVVASGVVSAIVSFVARRHEAALRIQTERAIKVQETDLRRALDLELQRARSEIESALKAHEIRLRVEADLRLKLVDRMLADVGQFRAKLFEAFNMIYRLTQEAEPRGDTDRFAELVDQTQVTFAAVPTSAAYMPPELLEAAVVLFHEAHECFVDVVGWVHEPTREQRTPKARHTSARIEAIGLRARRLFGAWQEKQFSMLLSGANLPVAKIADGENVDLAPGRSPG